MFPNFRFYRKKLLSSIRSSIRKRLSFFKKNDKENQRKFLEITSHLNPNNKKMVYFHHDLGGGSDLYIQNKVEQFKNDTYVFVIIYRQKIKKFNLQITFQDQFTSIFLDSFEEISNIFSQIKIDTIYISQIILFPDINVVFDFTKQIKKNHTKIIMLVHDYYSICAKPFLTKDDCRKCDVSSEKDRCDCDPKASDHIKKWYNFLQNQANEIICFSESSKKIISNFHPSLYEKIKVIAHSVPFLRTVKIKKHRTINIATIGSLYKIKGCDIISEMSEIIIKRKLPIKIISIGRFYGKTNKAIKVLGKYDRSDLPEIIEANKIDIVFIPSICPETFNYVSHEAMMMGLKVACFNLGAQAEYIGKYDQGLIISQINVQKALDEILNFVKNAR
jgi:glycosyltransferase involved in cell wall biosynthesis